MYKMFWIIVCFMTGLWPVGIFLLLQRGGAFSRKSSGRISGIWAVALALAGIYAIKYSGYIALFLVLGCLAMFLVNRKNKKQAQRDKKYLAITAHRTSMSLKEIAEKIPTTMSDAARDLERLIGEGKFGPDAYLDMSRKLLVLDNSQPQEETTHATRRTFVHKEVVVEAEVVEEKPQKAAPQEEPASARPQMANDEYEKKLEEIRQANRDIEDAEVSRKIYRIEALTAGIFEAVRTDPAKAPQAHKFMSYYLPTTLKLLTRYAQLERQSSPGPNIRAAMANISEILDKLVKSFEELLDRLYQNDVIDITAEIGALETMMARDGGAANPYTFESMKK